MLKLFKGYGALVCVKSWINAWTTTRWMHDARPLLCHFRCKGAHGNAIADDMRHCLECEVLWSHAGAASSGEQGGNRVARLAFGPEADETARIVAVARLVCAYGL